jgi:hypothetical protein
MASLKDMPVERTLFVRDRCPYVVRDTALWKYPVYSRSELNK